MLTVNINKKVKSVDDVYTVYISILEGITNIKFTKQERIVILELLKERKVTEKVKDSLKAKIESKGRIDNILTSFRKKGIIKNNELSPFFKEFKEDDVKFNITLTNES